MSELSCFKADIEQSMTIPEIIKFLNAHKCSGVKQTKLQSLEANYIYFSADQKDFVEEPVFAAGFELLLPTQLGSTGSLAIVISDYSSGHQVLELTKYANRHNFSSSCDSISIDNDKFDILIRMLMAIKSLKLQRTH